MNNNTENTRPFGYWLRSVGTLLDREFAVAFENEDASRGDWMLLNAVSGDKPGRADRLARKGKRLRTLEDRGWIVRVDDGWELTDDGRAAKERLGVIVEGIRARVSGAVSPDDFATTMDSLEAIARELGWEEGMRMPRRGFGRRFGHGFGVGRRGEAGESDQTGDGGAHMAVSPKLVVAHNTRKWAPLASLDSEAMRPLRGDALVYALDQPQTHS